MRHFRAFNINYVRSIQIFIYVIDIVNIFYYFLGVFLNKYGCDGGRRFFSRRIVLS